MFDRHNREVNGKLLVNDTVYALFKKHMDEYGVKKGGG